MKISKVIDNNKIPGVKNLGGRQRNPEYDKLASRAEALKPGKSIPVECETKKEINTLAASMKRRGFRVSVRGLTAYVSKVEE